jgi:hypothetical protein
MNILYPFTEAGSLRMGRITDFTVQGLRYLLLQERSLQIVVPLALGRLESEPLARGQHYSGDLLAALLQVSPAFWLQHPECHQRLNGLLIPLRGLRPPVLEDELRKALDLYLSWASPLSIVAA